MKVTYTKLKKEDTLGLRIEGDALAINGLRDGAEVEVQTKAGKVHKETIGKVVLKRPEDGYALAILAREVK